MKHPKVPKKLPIWLVKAAWDATAVFLKIPGKDETDAWNAGWRRVSKTEGGDACLTVRVIRRIE